jgi:micrococcal nuclease
MEIPTFRTALLLCALLTGCRDAAPASRTADSPPGTACEVARVTDGDTLVCADSSRVRLIGMDTPELSQAPFGREARQALLGLAPVGTTLRLERDVTARDRYGRVLAWVWAGDVLVNEALVRQGYAVLYTVPPNVKYAGRIERAQKAARDSRAGLWARNGFDCLPEDARRRRC